MKTSAKQLFEGRILNCLAAVGLLFLQACKPESEGSDARVEEPPAVSLVEAPLPEPAAPAVPPEPASAEQNSFDEVSAKLDTGGNLFVYLGTEQWLGRVSDEFVGLKELVVAVPGLHAVDLAEIEAFFGLTGRLLRKSGLEEISGVGMSGIALAPGQYRTKIFAHHYPGQGLGFMWRAFGREPHALTGLDLLPKETRLAGWLDLDLQLLWTALVTEVEAVGTPEVKEQFRQLSMLFKAVTGLELYPALESLGGEYGFGLMLDEERKIQVPFGSIMIDLPQPDALLAIRLKDSTLFERIAEFFAAMPNAKRTLEGGIHKLVVPPPIPFLPMLQPAMVYDGDYLLLATGPDLIERALSVKAGDRPGLRESPEFKALADAAPERGNGFSFVSKKFSGVLIDIQKRLLAGGNPEDKKMAGALENVFTRLTHARQSYAVAGNAPDGMSLTSIGNRQPAKAMVEGILFAPAGTIVAIAVPNFIKARDTAHRNHCLANLEHLDGATREWASVNGRPLTQVPHLPGILRHLKDGRLPECRTGGSYRLGATVAGPPTCTIAGHALVLEQ